ncbi:stage II sporulation protein M [uncultured Thiohalocapsa sp.]|uniref:stage II sporulation protein M n=1 Tax=uncultured Thiohalocapsa sp. TaxID=768990 RepID=UPI0025F7C6BB|nr:stage II sporulation protein M [uncultured Thiohalocapsa sp.]
MKQQAFEAAHTDTWRRLEALLTALEDRRTPGRDVPVQGLAQWLRAVSNHYALARARGYSPGLVAHLHALVRRGHRQLYRPQRRWPQLALHFATAGFPRAIRRHAGLFWLACALFFGPMLAMGLACHADPTLIHSLLDGAQVAEYETMYDPANTRPGRAPARQADDDLMMFGFYVWNNVGLALRTFAWGLLAGAGSGFVLVMNGLVIGAVAGHLTQLGFGTPFWTFVSGHSALELTGIAVAGTAGLLLGGALLAPGRHGRPAALRLRAAEAVPLVLGAMALLALAAMVEAFWSASAGVPPGVKYGVGATAWVLVVAYLLLAGRGGADSAQARHGGA